MTRKCLIAGILVGTTMAGCGPVGGGSDSGHMGDAGPSDTAEPDNEPPEIRDIQLTIKGDFSSKVTLNSDGATRVLPVPATAEFTVFARDNQTDTDQLMARAVDTQDGPLENETGGVQNGLMQFTAEVGPDMTIRVEVTDQAGNTTTSEHALRILSRSEALVDEWEKRFYNNGDQSIAKTHELTLREDGSWVEQLDDHDRGGDYRVQEGELVMQQTYRSGGEQADSDKSTVESDRRAAFYVDESSFAPDPWTRQNDGSGVAGRWERSAILYAHNDGARQKKADVSETLELTAKPNADNTWTQTRRTTPADGGMQETTRSGTWKTVEITTNYGKLYGTFLVRTTTHEDGQELDTPTTETELYRLTLDKLLLSPYARTSNVE